MAHEPGAVGEPAADDLTVELRQEEAPVGPGGRGELRDRGDLLVREDGQVHAAPGVELGLGACGADGHDHEATISLAGEHLFV